MSQLFRIAGFLPYIAMIFLNAFVDLGHKIVIQNTLFKTYDGDTQILLTAIVNALILLPFVLLFTPSGFLADRFPKPQVMRTSAWLAVGLTLCITLFYYLGWFWVAFGMTFLLAAQSAFYSPAKYGYIKELVGEAELTTANGWVQATTTTAILAGIFVFSILFETRLTGHSFSTPNAVTALIAPLGWVLVAASVIELILAYRLPLTHHNIALRFDWSRYARAQYLRDNLRVAWDNSIIWLSIVGLSIFWAISQVILAAFPAFAKETLGETNTIVIQGLLACSGLGIIIGSIIAGRLSRGHIETGLIPVGAIGIALALFILPGLGSTWAHALNFLVLGVLAGCFIVPLNALIQFNAGESGLGRVLAANNFVQNVVMLSFLAFTVLAAWFEIGGLPVMLTLAVVALGGALYTTSQLPQSLIRFLIGRLMATRYRLNVIGLENMPAQGGVLMLGNHVSWIDWAMVQLASPRPVRFVMERWIYERWYLRWFLDFFGVVPISRASSRQAIQTIAQLLDSGEVVCIFPEGTLSKNGQLSTFKRGFELSARAAQSGVILPFYQRGLWGSRFSYASDKLRSQKRRGRAREVIVAFGAPLPLTTNAERVKQAVFELSVSSWRAYVETLPTVPAAWLATALRERQALAIVDSVGTTLSNQRLLTAVLLFARRIQRLAPEPAVGILLPASSAGAIANLAALVAGKTVVNLNYTAHPDALRICVQQAGVRHVITAERFLRKLEQRGMVMSDVLPTVTLHAMETLRAQIGRLEALWVLGLTRLLPAAVLARLFGQPRHPDETAAILFSSGSEGTPKGIELTHRNILANVRQTSDVLNIERDDVLLANLPLFHAFGLTVTTFMPLLEGLPMVCHPDPTDALGTAKAIARYRATVFCGTSTFLRLYVRNTRIHPLMLQSLRIVVAGAERLAPEIRSGFALKFHKEILEGYGATETTPVASVNVPDTLETDTWKIQIGSRPGTVGMPLPGTSFRIVDPHTLETLPRGEDGLILIGGVQVMKGYLNALDKTAAAIVELDGVRWYKTGDKGHLDADGFLTIVDRYSRFAKIGGEMVSLSVVEDAVRQALAQPELELIAVTVPDERKGEQIVLLVVAPEGVDLDVDAELLRRAMLANGTAALMIPAEVRRIAAIPKLGSGKTDFGAVQRVAVG
ncbi:acyl-[acyl-carrier-protein]-phospholipid O-acyltransferase / long-chain-fatty-acid--[acyl-carrier-protein] ligase [Allochromatium warmingii]|uniref:Acyl-[acyl-carrier-protein]-phospholipid O-acyltransferase / long-chain-fatty-acid--[acyl-carrier-protein] ligase n=1 Tax=Allochromatium warmingii TaxID=61595 RepID=A0A1H3IHT7_ALLWA|nr:acyl-[ACP]--phospholipid O-acyltransferase [Allochromatium warmingii]SDY26638.1 acyl-[acyl-carrier-protein]-phospholipid O-acyltransferase / long-chain-fatty-acid--[acyl-carrier-protein] ligase [Allochromatium warmingii]